MSVRVVWDRAGIAALAHDPMMVAVTRSTAQAVVDAAKAASPYLTGHYKRSLRVSSPVADVRGVVCTVSSEGDPGAVAIEFGSVNNPPFAPVTKGVRALGLRLAAR